MMMKRTSFKLEILILINIVITIFINMTISKLTNIIINIRPLTVMDMTIPMTMSITTSTLTIMYTTIYTSIMRLMNIPLNILILRNTIISIWNILMLGVGEEGMMNTVRQC